jgi:hypothetical protein
VLAAAFALAAVCLTLSPVVVTGALVACALWCLIGPRQAVQGMTLSVLVGYANPALVTFSSLSGALMRVVLLAAALRVLPLFKLKDLKLLWPVWGFSLVAAITSAAASPAVAISLMKVITFAVAVTTVIIAFQRVRTDALPGLERWFWTLCAVAIVLSAALLLDPHAAFFRNGRGLQGVLNHPQALGTFLAPLAAFLIVSLVLIRSRFQPLHLALTGVTAAVMFMTQARTAAVAAILAIFICGIRWLWARKHSRHAAWSRVALVTALACVAITIAGAVTGELASAVEKFVFKRGEQNVEAAFLASRGGGMLSQWRHFIDKPLTGNGFGVYPDGRFPSGVVEIAGIPISAPVEKGFVPTAVLEETGVFGGLMFIVMLVTLGRSIWRNPDLRWLALFLACLFVNVGEAVLLAPGGIGLLIWLFIGRSLAMSQPQRRLRPSMSAAPQTHSLLTLSTH